MGKARDLASAAPAPAGVTSTELGYVDGVTSAIQTQLNAKQAVVSGVDDTEIGYLNGVTSAIQTQIDSKIGQSTAINPTIVDAKGDIIAASAADTVTRLAVGANDTVLTADSSTGTGLKWATPAAGGMTLIATANASTSASITLSSIPATYKDLRVIVRNFRPETDGANFYARFNGVTGENYTRVDFSTTAGTTGFTTNYFNLMSGIDNGAQSSLAWWEIPDYTNSTTWKMLRSSMLCNNFTTPANIQWANVHGYTNQTGAVSSITFFFNSGNITSGTFEVWGVK
jgi:hypothetical protein